MMVSFLLLLFLQPAFIASFQQCVQSSVFSCEFALYKWIEFNTNKLIK